MNVIPDSGYPAEPDWEEITRRERERQAREDYRAELAVEDWKLSRMGWDE